MEYTFLLELAIILLATKLLGLLMKKLGLPQVVGALIAGLLVGPAIWSPMTGGAFIPVQDSEFLKMLSELGVIMLMFSAGLETDIKDLKSTGAKAAIIASLGVILPLGLGFLVGMVFFNYTNIDGILACVFIGIILTATSVGITVETLREMGKLKGKVGTTILSAAIIDDVIGIIVLTFVIGAKNPSGAPAYIMIVNTILFFVFAIGVGIGLNFLFKWLIRKYPNKRRVPIFSLVVCLLYAFCAEKFFGIADITGAYLAGIMLSTTKERDYIGRKIDINSYMIFSPVFFARIGINTSFTDFNASILLFTVLFVVAGIFGKVVGCGVAAKCCKFSTRDSFKIGVGMVARGEVALIVGEKGINAGIVSNTYLTPIIMLVVVTSLLAPILLKFLYKGDNKKGVGPYEDYERDISEIVNVAIE